MIGIELFSGAGGMATGAHQAGIDIRIAVENDHYAAQTYLINHKTTTVIIDDIENIKKFRLEKKNDQVILFGGPPCQGFSYSNKKTRSKNNSKNWLFKELIRVIGLTKPDWIVIENVAGLKTMNKGYFLKTICEDLHKHGYTSNVKILNAADFGVPQKRERIFIVASKHGIAFEFPVGKFKDKHISVKEALFDLPKLINGSMTSKLKYSSEAKSNYAKKLRGNKKTVSQNYVTNSSPLIIERYKYVKQGNNWKDIPKKLMNNYKDYTRCHSNIYHRLSQNKPSVVISNYRKSMLIHPIENRGLSVREAARLQSFPDHYIFKGPLNQKQQQVGNAVPPLLAQAIFKKVLTYTI